MEDRISRVLFNLAQPQLQVFGLGHQVIVVQKELWPVVLDR
jgi:hypothetical protein